MAKRKAKASRVRSESSRRRSKAAKNSTQVMTYDDGEDELLEGDDDDAVISASEEDEGGSDDERKHRKLLEAISALGGKKRRKLAERSEASVQVSEFAVSAEGAGEKISLSDLLGAMDQTPSAVKSTKKQLQNLESCKDTLELPLSRQETEKIQRKVAFEKTSKDVSQWESIVKQNQRAEQLVFPLNQEPSGPKPVEHVVVGWKPRTPLEMEVFSLLHKNMQPINDPLLTPMEEASLKAMSLEEAKIRRAELQKIRALQSYYEAKAKRERKIKSKKYHKVLKKGKRKELLKEFEEMRNKDPAAALEELKKMELARMEERMSLKHQNSGKWAKSKAIMAKYDDEARKAMQQQLEMNKELTQKLALPPESEEEQEPEETEVVPDFANDAQAAADPANPWMMGKLSAEPAEKDCGGDDKESAVENTQNEEEREPEGDEEEENEEDVLLREFDEKRKSRRPDDDALAPPFQVDKEETEGEKKEEPVCVSSEDEHEGEVVSEFKSLFQKLLANGHESTVNKGTGQDAKESDAEEPALLDEGLSRVRSLEDVDELLGQGLVREHAEDVAEVKEKIPTTAEETKNERTDKRKKKKILDLNDVLTRDAKVISVPLAPTAIGEEEGEGDQRMLVQEAFAGDDVVADFLKDKKKRVEAGKPKVVDLTLPGWGEWGGVGLKPSRYKRRRFRIKVAPPPPRKDRNLPNVIISDARESSVAMHQVSQLPFSFEKPEQFECSIRTPTGHTWNTQRTVQKLTAPKVVTQLGSIIEPITRDSLDKSKAQTRGKKAPDIVLASAGAEGQGPRKGRRKAGENNARNLRNPRRRAIKRTK
ncbi:U3 small nucleolar RNA-associated protein 14 homolog A isoform X1 [Scleropages formosus]|uniref:U3 small nucleolar RNA-associated protein 14 homolog A isoform X1 n=1 Tax=Scleropages formosus TaxID=113540 RepID=UPI0010FAB348|nr:U3 small nucleolar RNA-associated protein 14 homolog A-like isoform X1 [Scleropages formosus]